MTQVTTLPAIHPDHYIWTTDAYHRLIELGILTEYSEVELLDGQIVNKMAIGEEHAATVEILMEFFPDRFGKKYRYRAKNPIVLPNNSEPEPDFVVSRRLTPGEKRSHPSVEDTFLVIEVSQDTLSKDRYRKGPIYAAAGIPEYWLINLQTRSIEVYSEPDQELKEFASQVYYKEGKSFNSPFAGAITVADLLPLSA